MHLPCISLWEAVASTLCDSWNVFGVDLMNEPYSAGWVLSAVPAPSIYRNVFGVDLMNEPYSAAWGDGSNRDWRRGAEVMGDMRCSARALPSTKCMHPAPSIYR